MYFDKQAIFQIPLNSLYIKINYRYINFNSSSKEKQKNGKQETKEEIQAKKDDEAPEVPFLSLVSYQKANFKITVIKNNELFLV